MKAILNVLTSSSRTFLRTRAARVLGLAAFMLAAAAPSVSAETLMMPKRDARMDVPVVVWGITTQASATACTLDYGDSTPVQNCTGTDRSYKAFTHTYTTQGVFTATLTVGTEVATTEVTVFNPALLPGGATGDNNRSLGINMAIQDGLRYLWTSQGNRTTFDTNPQTFWNSGGAASSETAMVVLGFQNHGYKLPSNPLTAPTGIYEKYAVQRGLNYVIASQRTIAIGATPQGDNPCVGLGADGGVNCTGLYDARYDNLAHASYTLGVAILPLASSGALNRTVALADVAGNLSGNYVAGKTYGEILQRQVNALAWGQVDANCGAVPRGGWFYSFNQCASDGSTVGWDILAMLDAGAAGALVPVWVKNEWANALTSHLNTNGSFDYTADANPASNNYPTPHKNGVGLQGLFWIGETTGARVTAVTNNANSWWPGAVPFGIGGNFTGGLNNHGNAYAMFNFFKGLKLQGITTLPDVNRSTRTWKFLGTTGVEDDWYADYQDWLVANQTSPTTISGGYWGGMTFSCCYSGASINAAIAELILSPVALVLPDGDKFAAVGLSPATNTAIEGGSHTVTAKAESTGGSPVPGATVNFTILTGPNAGLTGTDTTDSNGEATFTYTDAGPDGTTGTDTIRASIGSLNSNIVEMIWTPTNSNSPPTANAGTAYSGNEGSAIALSGATASDPDGDTLTYSWSIDSVLCTFSNASILQPSITCTDNGSFTATLTVSDGIAPAVVSSAVVTVANVAPVITAVNVPAGPMPIGSISISAPFTDAGKNDTHTCTIAWDDGAGAVPGTVTETANSGTGTCAGSKILGAGVYSVTVTVTDDDGDSDTKTETTLIVVYDPSAGFVTGGGWFDSVAGADKLNPTAIGRANFGFVAKYKKGASVPEGQTEFQFKAGDLNFHSTAYEWLVVTGGCYAQYKGTGTINGVGGYSFMITLRDGQLCGSVGPDAFRIKITGPGGLRYDNTGGTDDIGPTTGNVQALAGGSIVIHRK